MAYMMETVARLTEATVKQLIHWDQSGLIRPSVAPAKGKGSRRVYSFLDVLAIRTAVTLRREGVSLQKVRRCVEYLRRHQPQVEQPLASLNLLTDGVRVFLLSRNPRAAWNDKKVVDTLAGGQLLFLVPIGQLACEVQREAARLAPDLLPDFSAAGELSARRKRSGRLVRSVRKGVRAG